MGLFDGGARRRELRLAKDLLARAGGVEPYLKAGRFAEIEPNLRDFLAEAEAGLGEQHKITRVLRNQLTRVCNSTGRLEEAEQLALQNLTQGMDAVDWVSLVARQQYIVTLHGLGRHEESAHAVAAFAEGAKADPRNGPAMVLWAQRHRIRTLLLLQRFEEAELECGRALERADSVSARLTLQMQRAVALTQLGRADEAETLARQSLVATSAPGVVHPEALRRTLNRVLARALVEQGRHQEALDLLDQLDQLDQPDADESTPEVPAGEHGAVRARALLGLGRAQEAVPLARLALETARTRHREEHAVVASLRVLLEKTEQQAGLR